jgi:tRNA threonylcarbamoyladenosine biosynthesis protein TsaE
VPDRSLALTTTSVADTRAVGAAIAARLKAGDVVALAGDLGAGKTALVQGAAAALGVTLPVTSPTFVLVKHLPAPVPVVHVDVYRLERLSHVDDLDEDVFAPDVVTFVEWADRIAHLLPDDRLEVRLVQPAEGGPAEMPRQVTVTLRGDVWATRLEALEHGLQRWLDPDTPGV